MTDQTLSMSRSGRERHEHGCLPFVLRGPCYLGLRSIVSSGRQADGIVLLVEAGRSLTDRDVRDVCGVPVVAQVPVTASVARRSTPAFSSRRALALRELAGLGTYLDPIVARPDAERSLDSDTLNAPRQHLPTRSPSPSTASPPLDSSSPKPPSKNVT